MSSTPEAWQKFLRIASIVFIVVDVVFVVMGALLALGMIEAEIFMDALDISADLFAGVDTALAIVVLGWGMVVGYLVNLLANVLVLRGAKNPAKIKPGMVLYAIFSAICLVTLVSSIAGGTFTLTTLCQAIVNWVLFYGTVKVNQKAKAK